MQLTLQYKTLPVPYLNDLPRLKNHFISPIVENQRDPQAPSLLQIRFQDFLVSTGTSTHPKLFSISL
jgi:hypothetical protein